MGSQAETIDRVITRVTLLGVRGKHIPTLLLQGPHGWTGTVKRLEWHAAADYISIGVAGGWNTFSGLHATHPKVPLETRLSAVSSKVHSSSLLDVPRKTARWRKDKDKEHGGERRTLGDTAGL